MHTGTPDDAISALLIGKSSIITRITTNIEIIKSLMNDHTESPTTLGWSVIRVMLTLSGASLRNSPITLSTSFPKATILFSGLISTDRITALRPLNDMSDDGFLYLRSIFATSPSRRDWPSFEVRIILSANSFSLVTFFAMCTGELT